MSFLGELKRRNVYRVAAAYAIVAWMLVQVVSVFGPALKFPDWITSLVALIAVVGFPLALALSWVYELTPEGIKRTVEVPAERSIARVTGRRLNYVIVGAFAVAILFLVADDYVLREEAVSSAPAAAKTNGAPAPASKSVLPNSVAVLPFVNMSPNPDDAYFAQGVHEEVLNQLAKIGALNVIARTSVLRYADGKTALSDVARELNVLTVMEGSVRYAGDNVRITAQLIDAKTGAHLWSEAYQRKIDDIFAIQADIAMNIANALRATFSIEEQKAIERPATSSAEAYALFLQARALPLGANDLATPLLDRAIAIDPKFADAYAAKAARLSALLTNSAAGNGARPEAREAIERAVQDNVERALAIEPSNARALATLAARDVQNWRWSTIPMPKAESLASLFTPGSVWVQAWKGQLAEILRVSERWAEIDPKAASPFVNLGVLYAYAGKRDASDRALERALEIAPTSSLARAYLGYNAAARGDVDGTLREFGKVAQLVGDNVPIVFAPEMAYAYFRVGRLDEARKLFAKIEAAAQQANVGTGAWALGYLAIGDDANALRQLELAAEKARNHEPDASYLNLMNLKMNFLADPRITDAPFAEALAKIHGS